jgi:hypothetical protein
MKLSRSVSEEIRKLYCESSQLLWLSRKTSAPNLRLKLLTSPFHMTDV